MKQRMVSLLLALMMVVSLFAGLTTSASAATELADVFNRLVNQNQETVSSLFNANNMVLNGTCGKGEDAYKVKYEIYRVDPKMLTGTNSYKDLRSSISDFASKHGMSLEESLSLSDINFDYTDDQEYFAVKIFGNGEMEDYSIQKTAPWSGRRTIDNADVKLEEQLVAAYIEDGVTNVGERAFFGQDGLAAVYLGNSIKTIGAKAFESCDQLSVVTFPTQLESIERRAFFACDYLTFARMSSCINLKSIGNAAFACCNRLTSVSFPTKVATIGDFAFLFDHVLGTAQFSLPAGVKTIGKGAFFWCTHLGKVNEVNIPAQVTRIGEWAFFANFDMRELTFSDGGAQTMSIGTGAFVGCRDLQRVWFADRVRDIGDYAFAACDKLTEVVFGKGEGTSTMHINTLGDRAFTSLEATGLEALTAVANIADEESSDGDVVTWLGHSLTASYAITDFTNETSGVTPLAKAVFTYDPPVTVQSATDAMNTFPKDCVIIYPTQETNPQVYAKWHAAVTTGGRWKEYQTEASWTGHFHAYGDPIVVEATCTEPGYETYICSICGAENVIETKSATGHKAKLVKEIAPTCTEDGLAYYHCSNKWCAQPDYTEVLPATEHGKGDGSYPNLLNREETPATCTAAGRITGTCPDCGERVNVETPALGHSTTYMKLVKAPTCTQEGIYQGACDRCNQSNLRVTVPALGHSWDAGRITKRPTTEANGERTYLCTVCGETKTETIKRIGYTETFTDTVVDPTCTERGYTIHTGSDGTVYQDSYVDALGHDWVEGDVTKQPTASEAGTRVDTCSRCGEKRTVTLEPLGGIQFTDVPEDAFYYKAVLWAVKNNITQGTGNNKFSPLANCDRGQAVTFLYRAAGSPKVESSDDAMFDDVHPNDFYYDAVRWAVQEGVTLGVGGNRFAPNDPCDRSQIVTFLYRAAGSPKVSGSVSFDDVSPVNFFYDAVRWAVQNNITQGTGNNKFSPYASCDRAQMVTFIYRASQLK